MAQKRRVRTSIETPKSWRTLLRKPPPLTVSEWCDRYRVLDPKHSAEPGLWSTDRTPYLREIQDAFTDPEVATITLMKSARVGGSEAMYNMALYAADCCPGPALIVLPTEDGVSEEFKGRLRETIEACPRIRERIPEGKARWASEAEINLDSMRFYAAYAAAPVTLTRRTCRYVFFDELDNCEKEAGRLGSHLGLASERTTTYGYRGKTVSATTPTFEGSAGWQAYLASDQRRYHVPCPHCGAFQILVWERVKFSEDVRDPERIEADGLAWYQCSACDERIEERDRAEMVSRGVWIPRGMSVEAPRPKTAGAAWRPALAGNRPRTRRIGFHIWSAYSPWRTWSQIVAKFLRVRDNPEELRVFVNSWLGEPWRETQENIEPDELRAKIVGAPPPDRVPQEASVLIMAVDVQKSWLYYVIRAWGPMARSWLIRYGTAPNLDAAYAIALTGYPKEGGGTIAPSWMLVDTGYRHVDVHEFARVHPGVVPVKGQPGGNFSMRPTKIEYTPDGSVAKNSTVLWLINTWRYKDWILRAMKVPAGEPGYWGLHRETGDDYLQQVTAEQQVWSVTKRGKFKQRELVWQPKREGLANHYLDCEVYLTAQAEANGLLTMQPVAPPPQAPPTTDSPNRPRYGKGPIGYRPRKSMLS